MKKIQGLNGAIDLLDNIIAEMQDNDTAEFKISRKKFRQFISSLIKANDVFADAASDLMDIQDFAAPRVDAIDSIRDRLEETLDDVDSIRDRLEENLDACEEDAEFIRGCDGITTIDNILYGKYRKPRCNGKKGKKSR